MLENMSKTICAQALIQNICLYMHSLLCEYILSWLRDQCLRYVPCVGKHPSKARCDVYAHFDTYACSAAWYTYTCMYALMHKHVCVHICTHIYIYTCGGVSGNASPCVSSFISCTSTFARIHLDFNCMRGLPTGLCTSRRVDLNNHLRVFMEQ